MNRTLRALPALLAFACTGDDDSKIEEDVVVDGALTTRRRSVETDSRGIIDLEIPVQSGEVSLLVNARTDAEGAYPAIEALHTPDDRIALHWEDWYYGSESLTSAIFPAASDMSFNWPIRAEDGELEAGSWLLQVAANSDDGEYLSNVPLEVTIQTRKDPGGPAAGTVQVRIVYAEGIGDEPEVVEATEAAVERWREIWATRGLELEESYAQGSLSADLNDMYDDDDAIFEASSEGTDADLMVLIGETISGSVGNYGIAGAIPGTLVESYRGAVVISWLANAGGDGSFSQDDIRLYGETLAHEVGHYAGLFHPVEDGWQAWDALEDTSDCSSINACENALGDNLMFPYPICDWTSCIEQDQLTDGQVSIAHHYTGTL